MLASGWTKAMTKFKYYDLFTREAKNVTFQLKPFLTELQDLIYLECKAFY